MFKAEETKQNNAKASIYDKLFFAMENKLDVYIE
jgi:hypothetical protein